MTEDLAEKLNGVLSYLEVANAGVLKLEAIHKQNVAQIELLHRENERLREALHEIVKGEGVYGAQAAEYKKK